MVPRDRIVDAVVRLFVRRNALYKHLTYGNPRTISALEGLYAQIRDLLRRHRGPTEEHRRRAVQWFLALHEIPLEQALDLARPTAPPGEPDAPQLYGTGLGATEGLWHRSAWIGEH